MANAYSDTWFELFAETIDPAQTRREVDFLAGWLPLPRFRRVLDVCCGTGRHAAPLAGRGYDVTGIDLNEHVLERARAALGKRGRVLVHDMREIARLDASFDAVLIMWQSFGQFGDETNRDVVNQISKRLVTGGRFVLDIYHRGFFEPRLGTRVHEKLGRRITETKTMSGDRLTVDLDYGDGTRDRYAWQLFAPADMVSLASAADVRAICQCTEFDESRPPSPGRPRMQFVFEKP